MKICKKINKVKTDTSIAYYYENTTLAHNPNGPAFIFYNQHNENKIASIYYREKGVAKNRRKGPIFVSDLEATWLSLDKEGREKALCQKYYFDDMSISTIETYTNDMSISTIETYTKGYLKTRRRYKKGQHFDNIKREFEIAQKWI